MTASARNEAIVVGLGRFLDAASRALAVPMRILGPPDSTISLVQTSGAYRPQAASRVARRP